jgi:hypothetical protein
MINLRLLSSFFIRIYFAEIISTIALFFYFDPNLGQLGRYHLVQESDPKLLSKAEQLIIINHLNTISRFQHIILLMDIHIVSLSALSALENASSFLHCGVGLRERLIAWKLPRLAVGLVG